MALGRIGDYEILERIGAGGMGVVFRARDIGLNALRAVKVVSPAHADDSEYLERLRHEAQTVARLQHPNIAICHHCGEAIPEPADLFGPPRHDHSTRPAFFMAMEFVEGSNLDEYAAHRRLPVREVVGIALQIASGLEAAHDAGVIHRDLKPGNIRLTPRREVKILDFGLAHSDPGRIIESWASTQGRSRGTVGGTPLYMAPEQARRRDTSPRSDLYSLGVVLYELLAGRLPYARGRPGWDSDDPAAWAVDPIGRHRPEVPARLAHILGRMLEFEPAARYADAGELRRELEPLALPPKRARRWVVGIGALALLATASRDLPAWIAIRADPPARNVAVLEIASPIADPQLRLLASGLAADLYDGLRKEPGVNALRPSGRHGSPAEVRKEVGAGSMLRGTVVRRGARAHLDIELLDTASKKPRWKADYDLEPGSLFGVREQIVASVSDHVARFGGRTKAESSSKMPSAAAYEEYLRGIGRLDDLDDPTARDQAAASFDRALHLDPGFALAWAGEARALWWLYDRDHDTTLLGRAERSANRALALAPGLVEARLARAKLYGTTGRTSQAIDDLLDIVRSNPTSEEAHRQLGYAYRKSGDLERAEKSFRRSVEISPTSPSPRYAIAGFLQSSGRLKEAEQAWTWATRVAPERNRPWEGLAGTYIQEGRYADAVRIFEQLPEPLADGARWSNMATAYFYSRNMDKALAYYLRAVAKEPSNPDLRLNLGDCYTRMGRVAEAREQYWEALRFTERDLVVDADNPRLHVMHVLDLAKVGDRVRASREFEAHLHQPAKDSDLLYQLAKAAALLGKDADAIMLLQQARMNGMKPALFRDDDEFGGLRDTPAFRKLLRG